MQWNKTTRTGRIKPVNNDISGSEFGSGVASVGEYLTYFTCRDPYIIHLNVSLHFGGKAMFQLGTMYLLRSPDVCQVLCCLKSAQSVCSH